MPYGWSRLPPSLPVQWPPYSFYLNEFGLELANAINRLTYAHARLQAWTEALEGLQEGDQDELYLDLIDDIATTSLTLPRAIKDRFVFAAVHLCHQANRISLAPGWKDDLPSDRTINQKHLARVGAPWKTYDIFSARLERIAGRNFKTATHNFRDLYHHRTPVRIMIGNTQTITRCSTAGKVSYAIGSTPPLSLKQITSALESQLEPSYAAFEAFQRLVWEQEEAIMALIG